MSFIDLDLDVLRAASGDITILDRDQFEAHQVRYGYPDHLVEAAERSCAEVTALLADDREPFAHSPRRWLAAMANSLRDPDVSIQLG